MPCGTRSQLQLSGRLIPDCCHLPQLANTLTTLLAPPHCTVFMHDCVLSYWDVTPLQHCVSFCYTTTWISHRYMYIPPPTPPHPSPLGRHRALSSAPGSRTVFFNPHDASWLPKPSMFDSKASPALPAGGQCTLRFASTWPSSHFLSFRPIIPGP